MANSNHKTVFIGISNQIAVILQQGRIVRGCSVG
jgi:hypothetical protein